MSWRRKRRQPGRVDQGPVVFDSAGVPVGVFVPLRASAEEATKAGRYHVRLAALKKTRELEHQYQLRSSVCLFCATPPF